MTPLERVLDRLDGVRCCGSYYMARCPAHDDRTPSLKVCEAEDGKVLLHCFAGCEKPDVAAALGLTMADLWPRRGGDRRSGHVRAGACVIPDQRRIGAPLVRGWPHAPHPVDAQLQNLALDRFCVERGWQRDVVDLFGLTVVEDRTGYRVRFPYRRAGERLWAQFRALAVGQEPRWLSPPSSVARPRLYAHDLAESARRMAVTGRVVVAEGPTDVVALTHVMPDAAIIGLPGTSTIPFPRVVDALARCLLRPAVVTIATDADKAGDGCADRLAAELRRASITPRRLRPPDGLDLDGWRRLCGDDERWVRVLVGVREAAS